MAETKNVTRLLVYLLQHHQRTAWIAPPSAVLKTIPQMAFLPIGRSKTPVAPSHRKGKYSTEQDAHRSATRSVYNSSK
jgi:hypothetical protein